MWVKQNMQRRLIMQQQTEVETDKNTNAGHKWGKQNKWENKISGETKVLKTCK